MHIRNGLELGDIVEITNYLGVYEHEMPTKNQYKKYCTCKEAEQNKFRILEFVDDDSAVIECITSAEPFNLLVNKLALFHVVENLF